MSDDMLGVIVGGAIGFLSSIGMLIINSLLDRKGKLNIFYKIINIPNKSPGWGILSTDSNNYLLCVPIAFELQNTSNTTRVIRDLSLELYNGKSFVLKLIQNEKMKNSLIRDNEVVESETTFYGTDNGSYSFMLQPRSIQKQKCFYAVRMNPRESNNKQFDTIRISYYNERNHKKSYILKTDLKGWNMGKKASDKDWQRVK